MKPRLNFVSCFLIAGLSLLAVAGCNIVPPVQADATRYYVLAGPATGAADAPPAAGALRLGLRPVDVAPYLKKGSLVVRTGENEVSFPDDARWAEPLDQEITRTLRLHLLAAPGVGRVFASNHVGDDGRDFDVAVQVLRCEGAREGGAKTVARFSALVEITSAGENPRLVARKSFVAPDAAWDGKDFARLAALLGDAVGALGREIAGALPEKR